MKQLYLLTITAFSILLAALPGHSQQSEDDFDVLSIPVARSAEAPTFDFSAANLNQRGLSLQAINTPDGGTMPLGEVQAGDDNLSITLDAGEAVRLWSAPIPLNATAVHLRADLSMQGPALDQAAAAVLNANNPISLGAMLSFGQEIPRQSRPFVFEFSEPVQTAIVLLQFVGPQSGQSTVTLNNLRLLKNAQMLDFALSNTAITPTITFESDQHNFQVNTPPTSGFAQAQKVSGDTRSVQPESEGHALSLQTQSAEDVLQVQVPLALSSPVQSPSGNTSLVYARAYIKRVTGDDGILSLALFSSLSSSGGYRDYPIAMLPPNQWVEIETPVRILPGNTPAPLLILQYREGGAHILVDDVSLHRVQDRIHHWQADTLNAFQD